MNIEEALAATQTLYLEIDKESTITYQFFRDFMLDTYEADEIKFLDRNGDYYFKYRIFRRL